MPASSQAPTANTNIGLAGGTAVLTEIQRGKKYKCRKNTNVGTRAVAKKMRC